MKINELIKELCPNGVEWKTLGEVMGYEQPSKYIVKSTDYSNEGTPVLTAGASFVLGYTEETDGIYNADNNNPVIIFDDFTTSFHWVNFDFKVKSSAMKMLKPISTDVNFKFVYYSMRGIKYVPVEHSRQWIGTYSQFQIPLPPLAIQTRIVEILDHFTNLTANLKAELNLRRKQFEHYREKLLAFGEYVEKMKVPSFCELKAGKSINASELNDANEYWCFGGNGTRGKVSFYSHNGDFAIIGRQGALCGCVSWATGKFYATEHAVVVTPKENVNSRFLFHLFTFANLNQYKSQGAQPGLSVTNLNELSFPIPPLATQQSIVSTLDKFTALIANIEQEIALRQKQYEYYREQLLSFERLTF